MYDYLEQVPFFVYVIESPSAEDFFNNRSEGEMLRKTLSLHDLNCVLKTTTDRKNFINALEVDVFNEIERHSNMQLIIHISAHGYKGGLCLTSKETIGWTEIAKILEPINVKMNGTLLLCLSACDSSSACTMGQGTNEPFISMVANKSKPSWSETATAYSCFYHLFSKGHRARDVVEIMCKASDNEHFVFATLEEIKFVERLSKKK